MTIMKCQDRKMSINEEDEDNEEVEDVDDEDDVEGVEETMTKNITE
jgi:hypothetical protein